MSNILTNFEANKKALSPYISLKNGESAKVIKLKEIKEITKAGFSGGEVNVIRLTCDVDTVAGIITKTFDNGSLKFASEMIDKGIDVGASFTITRTGDGPKTRYTISDVTLGE